MRKVREILRLRFERGLSHRQISASTGVSKGALSEYLRRAADAWRIDVGRWRAISTTARSRVRGSFRLSWVATSRPDAWRSICRGCTASCGAPARDAPAAVARVSRRGGAEHAVGRDAVRLQPVLRSVRSVSREARGSVDAAGAPRWRKVFIALLGQEAAHLVSSETGEGDRGRAVRSGAGRVELRTYAEATRSQAARGFLGASTVRAFEFFGGVPQIAVRPISCAARSAGPGSLRPRDQPDVRRAGAALRRRDRAGAAGQAHETRRRSRRRCCWRSSWILACLRNP